MKIIYNNIIPFGNYLAINLFGVMFAKGKVDEVTVNHESIHTEQMKELLYVFFYIFYGIEWFLRLFTNYLDGHAAYRNISFEREAYANEKNMEYIKGRKRFSFLKYFKEK